MTDSEKIKRDIDEYITKNHPQVVYEGTIPTDDDLADYYAIDTIKAVRVG
ncbi:hypothetical protein SAMN05216389_11139 [Oceanobacillus limi]|uniref:Uncharacterized protein n=1 Tax=Oceanobacillus limi TaxID=930131 RepID=A0A1I0EC56_9BACI|nr:hypothetical protein [Oceanobacillus limi]SET42842.1 hypothetical protein SAMN05216389_11139 [Oceanobacillus limi]